MTLLCKLILLLTVMRSTHYAAHIDTPRYLPMHSLVEVDSYPDGSTFRFIHNNRTVKRLWMEAGVIREANGEK